MARAAKKRVKAKNKKPEPVETLDAVERLLVARKFTDDVYKATLANKYKEYL